MTVASDMGIVVGGAPPKNIPKRAQRRGRVEVVPDPTPIESPLSPVTRRSPASPLPRQGSRLGRRLMALATGLPLPSDLKMSIAVTFSTRIGSVSRAGSPHDRRVDVARVGNRRCRAGPNPGALPYRVGHGRPVVARRAELQHPHEDEQEDRQEEDELDERLAPRTESRRAAVRRRITASARSGGCPVGHPRSGRPTRVIPCTGTRSGRRRHRAPHRWRPYAPSAGGPRCRRVYGWSLAGAAQAPHPDVLVHRAGHGSPLASAWKISTASSGVVDRSGEGPLDGPRTEQSASSRRRPGPPR